MALLRRHGVNAAKIEAIWSFQTSDLFCDAERAALDLAQAAGSIPNNATDQQFENLKQYYSKDEIVDILAVISYFGFLNRWNDTLATPLEETPLAFAESHLATSGWQVGKHSAR
ncbi:MAG: alkylhydroperoxidase family enzyme [Arenicella sp.]